MKIQAAIFDMDGLLLDTERVCMKAFKSACLTLNIPFLEDTYLKIIGCNAKGIEDILTEGYQAFIDYEPLRLKWMENYHPIVEHQAIPLKSGVINLLHWLKENNIPIAIATSTPKALATTKLKLAGIWDYFDTMANGCEVTLGKPHPEIFLLAAKRLNIAPENCIAFEDSNNGVISAVSAKMQTFQIPDLVTPSEAVIALDHQVCNSLDDALLILKKRV